MTIIKKAGVATASAGIATVVLGLIVSIWIRTDTNHCRNTALPWLKCVVTDRH